MKAYILNCHPEKGSEDSVYGIKEIYGRLNNMSGIHLLHDKNVQVVTVRVKLIENDGELGADSPRFM